MVDHLEYNTERSLLILPENGRHIQKLVNHCLTLENREERNEMAKAIIGVMGNLNPHLRDVPDFQHALWDQLFIMAQFKLDVDSPYPIPDAEELMQRPEKLEYPQNFPKYRFYGNNIQRMITAAVTWEDGEKKDALVYTIANHMKKSFLNWNKDTVDDDVIFQHLYDMSDGKINLKGQEEGLSASKDLISISKTFKKSNNNNRGKNNNNRKNYRRKRY